MNVKNVKRIQNISENKILDMDWEEMKEFLEKYIREITQIEKENLSSKK